MRVIPIDAGIGKVHAILERALRRHWILRDMGHAVETVVKSHAVPVNGRRKIRAVGEVDDDRRTSIDLNQRARVLAIETQHRH